MSKKKAAKKEHVEKPAKAEKSKDVKKSVPDPEPTPDTPSDTVSEPEREGPINPQPAEQIQAEAPKPAEPNEPPPRPVISYEVLDSSGTDDQFEYVRVNVKVTPPFNGFDESIITVPCPIHNSKGKKTDKDKEMLIKEKAAWKVNSHMGGGAHSFNADDVKSVEEMKG